MSAFRSAMICALAGGSQFLAAAPALSMTEYLGGGFVELSEACLEHGWNDRQQVLMRAQPQGLSGNPDNETQIALFFATGTIAFRVDLDAGSNDGSMTTTYDLNGATYVWNGPYTPQEPTMQLATGFRETIGFSQRDRRPDVEIFYLRNFNEHADCTARFVVMLAPNPA